MKKKPKIFIACDTSNIAKVNSTGTSTIKVTGHTDNVPLVFGSQYRDNWDLAAARASSVVQNLEETFLKLARRKDEI